MSGCQNSAMHVKINSLFATACALGATLAFVIGTVRVKVNSSGISSEVDANAVDITFGDGNLDPSIPSIIALFLSLVSFVCCLVGFIKAVRPSPKYKTLGKLFGAALGFNICYYIYMIEYEAFSNIKISPGFGWGAGVNISAFINIIFALVNSQKLAKKGSTSTPATSPGGSTGSSSAA